MQIDNARDLKQALQSGRVDRVQVGPCQLTPSDYANVHLNHVRMLGTKLTGVEVTHLVADRWHARGVEMMGTRFEGGRFKGCDISNSLAQALQWPRAVMRACRFTETPLTNANFARAVLLDCHFSTCDLNHTNLTEALLIGCSFSDPRQGGAVLDNANLSGAVLTNVNLRSANLLRASFDGAVLVNVDLSDCNLTGASFRNAVLIGVKADRAEMTRDLAAKIHGGGGGLDDIATALSGHDPALLSMMLAAALTGLAKGGAPSAAMVPAAAAGVGADPVAGLLKLDFPTLVRELQGKSGPAELGRLRVDGSHVYARGVDGNEVRLTSAERSQPVQAAPMAVPDPEPRRDAPPPRANPAPAPSASAIPAPMGDPFADGGLEID